MSERSCDERYQKEVDNRRHLFDWARRIARENERQEAERDAALERFFEDVNRIACALERLAENLPASKQRETACCATTGACGS